jgi:hypothetical protein
MPPRDIFERLRQFALQVRHFCRLLPNTDEAREVAGQDQLRRILSKALTTSRQNTKRAKDFPDS